MKRRSASLPLHGGKAPRWLFDRMARLAGAVTMAVVDEYGPGEMLRRLSDPWWFQAFGAVLGFDWHSSGVTTVTCGALREAGRLFGDDLGIVVAGGKGRTSRKTPEEIAAAADRLGINRGEKLIYASRMSAKVDSAAVQDGFQIYHHSFFLIPSGAWCVVQQGKSDAAARARRYHWLGERVDDFVCEPHQAVENLHVGSHRTAPEDGSLVNLNMVAREAGASRSGCAALARENPDKMMAEVRNMTEGPTLFAPSRHSLLPEDVNLARLQKVLVTAHERHPLDFEALLGTRQVGPAAVRSLALLAEIIHGAPISRRDPAGPGDRKWGDYAFAHGGKDGIPFPVDRKTYDRSTEILLNAVRKARLGERERSRALRRLSRIAVLD